MEQPKRRCELVLKVSADSLDELFYALEDFANQHHLDDIDLARNTDGFTAGGAYSYSYDMEYKPDRTPEQYKRMRDDYLAEKKQRRDNSE